MSNQPLNGTYVLETLQDLTEAVDTFYVLLCGFLVFIMQAGFAMLTAGSVSVKNVKNAIMKNMFDACVGGLAFWLFGYGFAYGEGKSAAPGFVGVGNFALSDSFGLVFNDSKKRLHDFFFQWTFAATSATIVSGSVAERTTFYAYLACAFLINAWVYPVVAHWVWSDTGFLGNLFNSKGGVVDFAGCTVVHTVGGFAGLVGSILVKPRKGRFDEDGKPTDKLPLHSAPLASIGTFLLWFGWYGFNAGSTGQISHQQWKVAERCAISTTLAASSGGLTTLVLKFLKDQTFDLQKCLNGLLAGLVSVTACCAFVDPWSALVISAVGAALYYGSSILLLKAGIDDPLDAFPIHGVCGIWGALAGSLFNKKEYTQLAVGYENSNYGLFYGGGAKLLLANGFAIVCTIAWTVSHIGALFLLLSKIGIKVRTNTDVEKQGNDEARHGGPAYPYFQLQKERDNDNQSTSTSV